MISVSSRSRSKYHKNGLWDGWMQISINDLRTSGLKLAVGNIIRYIVFWRNGHLSTYMDYMSTMMCQTTLQYIFDSFRWKEGFKSKRLGKSVVYSAGASNLDCLFVYHNSFSNRDVAVRDSAVLASMWMVCFELWVPRGWNGVEDLDDGNRGIVVAVVSN